MRPWATTIRCVGAMGMALAAPGCSDDESRASSAGGNGAGASGATGNAGGSADGGAGAAGNAGAQGGAAGGPGGAGQNCDCAGKECGSDGCDGVCGVCGDGESCHVQTGTCQGFCGNSCAGACGPCPANSSQSLTCTASGICKCDATCTPSCLGKACGDDGCGGTCGPCDGGTVCAFSPGAPTPWTCQAFAGADPDMSFFLTSRGNYDDGGDFGGLAGADAFCAQLATEVGVTGKTWRAYLSTSGNPARDRIGAGPWINARGDAIVPPGCGGGCVDALHMQGLASEDALTELGTQIDWANAHDILTGSNADGTPSLSDCAGWTSNDENQSATVGHSNEQGSWNASHTTGCDRVGMQCTAGQGHVYCFAL